MPVHYSLVSLQTQKRLKQSLKIGFSSMLREVPLFYGTSLVDEGSCLELGGDQSGSPLISVLGGDVVSALKREGAFGRGISSRIVSILEVTFSFLGDKSS
jgi:hypothetical protein